MKRLGTPLVTLVLLLAVHLLLGWVLAKQEPLAALLTGRYWVPAVAVSLLGVRLAIFFAVVPWVVYQVLIHLADRVIGKVPPSPDQR